VMAGFSPARQDPKFNTRESTLSRMRVSLRAEAMPERLADCPRFPLATLPTPLHDAPRLRDALGGPK